MCFAACRFALGQKNSFHLVAVQRLQIAANADNDGGGVHGLNVGGECASVAHLDRVMGERAEFVTDGSARDVVGSEFYRIGAVVVSFAVELKEVLTLGEFHLLRRLTVYSVPSGAKLTVDWTAVGANGPSSFGTWVPQP